MKKRLSARLKISGLALPIVSLDRLVRGVFFIFVFFKKNLQKYIFGFRFYSFIPLPPDRRAAGGLPPAREVVGTYI